MANEIEIVLTQKGFFAGKKLKNGTLSLGAHKISEDEIIHMMGVLIRTFEAKTGKDTLAIQGNDKRVMIVKLATIVALAAADEGGKAEEGQ